MGSKKASQYKGNLNEYQNQLRRDWPSAIATFAVVLACVTAGASILTLFSTTSPYPLSQPQFWIFAIPIIIWVNYLQKYRPVAVIIFRVMMVLIIPFMLILTFISYKLDPESLLFCISTTVLSCVLIAISLWFYRKSLLRKQGPIR